MVLTTFISLALLAAPPLAQIFGGEVDEVLLPAHVQDIFAWGDLDQDGAEDLVVRYGGRTELLLGPTFTSIPLHSEGDWMGATVLPDLDQDGWLDVLLWNGSQGIYPQVGRILAISSQTGTILYDLIASMGFGWAVVAVTDLDGDGLDDWVTAYGIDRGSGTGEQQAHLRACSSIDGSTIWDVTAGNPSSYAYPTDLAAISDLDGDGSDDLVFGNPFESALSGGGSPHLGAVHLVSIQSGAMLLDLPAPALPGGAFGYQVEGLPDVNADGLPDFAVGSPDRIGGAWGQRVGAIEAYSGADGSLIWEVPQDAFFDPRNLGMVMGGGCDMDDDSTPDLWTTFKGESTSGSGWHEAVLFVSGRTGKLLFLTTPISYSATEEAGLGCFDYSGDGSRDFVMPYQDYVGSWFLWFLSRDRWIAANNSTISVSQGGTSAIEIDFPGSARYYLYKVLVSGSGTGPMDVNGVKVPLTYDLLVLQSYLGQLPPITSGFAGVLDSAGDASASIDIPPGSLSANLAGRSFHFAAIAGPPWEWRLATGYRVLTLVQ